jgi:cysteinyl-tRNA synthetase
MIKKDEQTVQLVDEIGELKEILREVSRKLTRIETKVKRGATAAASKTSEVQNYQAAVDVNKSANLSAENVLQVYEELRLKAKNGNEQEVTQKLLAMSATDLNLMCCELGMPPTSKNPSRRKMFDLIIGRIKQSLMLSRHIDRQTL